jgi:hypothetical protein
VKQIGSGRRGIKRVKMRGNGRVEMDKERAKERRNGRERGKRE